MSAPDADMPERGSADLIECYGSALLGGKDVALNCALYLPDVPRAPLVIWFHGGAFLTGHYQQHNSRILGRRLRDAGIAMASLSYRLKTDFSDLSADMQSHFEDIQSHRRGYLKPFLSRHRALAAMEDGFRFLVWAQCNAERFGWSERRVLAGASAGGITAFNMAFTAPVAGFAPTRPDGIISASGGHAYPALVDKALVGEVLALHNPLDDRVAVRSVREMTEVLGDQMTLIESEDMTHGKLAVGPLEKRSKTYGRIIEFVRRVTG